MTWVQVWGDLQGREGGTDGRTEHQHIIVFLIVSRYTVTCMCVHTHTHTLVCTYIRIIQPIVSESQPQGILLLYHKGFGVQIWPLHKSLEAQTLAQARFV